MKTYINYPNFILDSLPLKKIRSAEIYVLHVIIEFTYGNNKSKARIPISIFEEMINIDKRNVRRSLKKLEAIKAIKKEIVSSKKHYYFINEDFFRNLNIN